MTTIAIRRALLSVSDKTGLIPFAERLVAAGVTLISTGGTARALAEAGLPVTEVASVTGVAEMLDGRVKTLHPAIHGGLLADRANPSHMAALEAAGIEAIDLVVVNLYPFEASGALSAPERVERIDVGGPTMTRAAAKNFGSVTVAVDPADYDAIGAVVGAVPLSLRKRLAAKAFSRLAAYDAAIAAWLTGESADEAAVDAGVWHAVGGARLSVMRYGENPHQGAALYGTPGVGLAGTTPIQGKPLSYNNVVDADAAWGAARDFGDAPAAVIVKHANPCGIAVGKTLCEALDAARACDPVSAFGGVIALTRPLDVATAEAIAAHFVEVVIAPAASDEAKAVLSAKPAVRVLLPGPFGALGRVAKTVDGGLLVQDADDAALPDFSVVSASAPTEAELSDLRFAWRAVKHVKSNAILLAKGGRTVGVGAGQMSRVDAATIAVAKAGEAAVGAMAASDAFFPFADGLLALAEAGVRAVVQPGGSKRDGEVIAAANAHDIAMVTTGMRHFRH